MRRQEQSKQGFSLKLACQLYVAELYDVQAGALNTGRQIWFEYGPSSKVLAVSCRTEQQRQKSRLIPDITKNKVRILYVW